LSRLHPTISVLHAFTDKANIKTAPRLIEWCKENKVKLNFFLDSGAFTVFTKRIVVDIYEYMAFLDKNKDMFCVYANLDVIGNSKASAKNFEIMESNGFNPLPVVHFGTSRKEIQKMAEKYDYLGQGCFNKGLLGKQTEFQYAKWVEKIAFEVRPGMKFHAFGVADPETLFKLKAFSADSTMASNSRFGIMSVYNPQTRQTYRFGRTSVARLMKNKGLFRDTCKFYGVSPSILFEGKGWKELTIASAASIKLLEKEVADIQQKEFRLFLASFSIHLVKKLVSYLRQSDLDIL
jgi:hypothetical protein